MMALGNCRVQEIYELEPEKYMNLYPLFIFMSRMLEKTSIDPIGGSLKSYNRLDSFYTQ